MTPAFRNVDGDVSNPVGSWPQEALQAAMERGDISHWRRIAAEVRRSPWGPVVRAVEEILTYSRPYGMAGLMERASPPLASRPLDRKSRRWPPESGLCGRHRG